MLVLAGGRAMKNLEERASLFTGWLQLKNSVSVTALTQLIYDETGLVEGLKKEKTIESLGRAENLLEFLSLTTEYDEMSEEKTLEGFLAGTSLEASVDSMDESDTGVLLMTLHSAKGLEFSVVFMPGMEENLFPSPMSLNEGNEEEERRLCYVGLTRAKEKLFLSNAQQRNLFGGRNVNAPSRFLEEIPNHCLDVQGETAQSTVSQRKERWRRPLDNGPAAGFGNHVPETGTGTKPVMGKPGDSRDEVSITAGVQVRHPSFGKGTVVAREGEVVTIAFPEKGIKKITLGYVALTIE